MCLPQCSTCRCRLTGTSLVPNDGPANPGGDGFMRLHEWYGFASDAGPNAEASGIGKQFLDEGRATGAVLVRPQYGGTGRSLGR